MVRATINLRPPMESSFQAESIGTIFTRQYGWDVRSNNTLLLRDHDSHIHIRHVPSNVTCTIHLTLSNINWTSGAIIIHREKWGRTNQPINVIITNQHHQRHQPMSSSSNIADDTNNDNAYCLWLVLVEENDEHQPSHKHNRNHHHTSTGSRSKFTGWKIIKQGALARAVYGARIMEETPCSRRRR